MNEAGIIFALVVTMAFCVQVYNYWNLGQGRVNRYAWLFVLGCFVVSESMVAYHQPVYILYVLLNVFGILNLWKART